MTVAQNVTPADQDISAIKDGEWPEHEFPLGPRERPTRRGVIFKQSVLNDVRDHGRGAPDVEVCGVLVGNVYRDAIGPFVFIQANIRGNFSAGRNAQVTFTAQTWSHIQDEMDHKYPDLRILGWYHTHPGHGIFLSDMDLFIHKNFFSLPWHLAFVFDPQNLEEGLFAWRQGNMVIESFVVQKDAPTDLLKVNRRVPDAPPEPIATVDATTGASAYDESDGTVPTTTSMAAALRSDAPVLDAVTATLDPPPQHNVANSAAYPAVTMELKDLSARLQALEKRQRWTMATMSLLLLLAIGWPIALAAMAVMHGTDGMPAWLRGIVSPSGNDPVMSEADPARPTGMTEAQPANSVDPSPAPSASPSPGASPGPAPSAPAPVDSLDSEPDPAAASARP